MLSSCRKGRVAALPAAIVHSVTDLLDAHVLPQLSPDVMAKASFSEIRIGTGPRIRTVRVVIRSRFNPSNNRVTPLTGTACNKNTGHPGNSQLTDSYPTLHIREENLQKRHIYRIRAQIY